MARFRSSPRFLDVADRSSDVGKVGLDGFQRWRARPELARLGQIGLPQALNLCRRGGVLVLGAREVEGGLLGKPRRLGSLEENKILVLPYRVQGYEVQLVPKRV